MVRCILTTHSSRHHAVCIYITQSEHFIYFFNCVVCPFYMYIHMQNRVPSLYFCYSMVWWNSTRMGSVSCDIHIRILYWDVVYVFNYIKFLLNKCIYTTQCHPQTSALASVSLSYVIRRKKWITQWLIGAWVLKSFSKVIPNLTRWGHTTPMHPCVGFAGM